MSDLAYQPRGLYYEEIEVGKSLVTAGRTITESDIVSFAGISGDFNQLHVDAEYAKAGEFGQRVAHGLLVVSVTTGLIVQTGVMEGTVLAFRELQWKFARPVFIGDTIRAEMTITESKALPRLGGGSVTAKIRVYDQHDQVVQRGTMVLLVRSRPA
ncbi:MAG: MaoC family dehydratase N-terminal domain-containing protein [Chloroflexota bacterium]|nr:MAG: MaoC family dehydratase N-terminal domain-containing protein [Chloroflexota bacterium]